MTVIEAPICPVELDLSGSGAEWASADLETGRR
jgi:hypothetical protein